MQQLEFGTDKRIGLSNEFNTSEVRLMDRRQFLAAFGSAAVAHRVAGNKLAALEHAAPATSGLSLKNGGSRLDLVPGPDGYGLALFTSDRGKMERVGQAIYP